MMRYLKVIVLSLVAMILQQQFLLAQSRRDFYYIEPYTSRDLSKITFGIGGGVNLFKNDLHGLFEAKAQNSFMNFHITGDMSFRLTNYISIRSGLSYYNLYGQPSSKASSPSIQELNPSVSSQNTEGYVAIVHDLFSKERIDRGRVSWNIYALGGVGLTQFEPKDAISGEELRPSADEIVSAGQYPYARIMPIFPVGLGVAYYFADNHAIALEATYRFSTSDWMDNAWWKSGSPNFDGYAFIGIRYQYTLLSAGGKGSGFNYKGYQKRARKKRR